MMWLKIEGIQLKDALDKGSKLDPQSPAVYICIGEEELKTRRMVHAGVNATFVETFEMEIEEGQYDKLDVEVEVFNKGFTGTRNYHVGTFKEPLKNLIPRLNERMHLVLDLSHINKTEKVKKGQLLLTAILYDAENAKEAMVANAVPAKQMNSEAVEKLSDESKAEFIQQMFGDVGELLDDTHCALQAKFIVHGRMYITKRYMLFYSKLFGAETKIRIPFHQVVSITRGFVVMPLMYVDTGSKKYTFHSFWDFEVGYRRITGHFDRFVGQRDLNGFIPDDTISPDRMRANSSVADVVEEHEGGTTTPQDAPCSMEAFKAEAAKARYKIVVITEQTLPVGLDAFAKQFIEDDAPFNYKAYHESVKDTNVVMGLWQQVAGESKERGRDIKFFKPVNLPGLASTRGVKLQNLKRFGDHGLLLSSSTRLEDVPAADCFSVDDTLEVQANGPDSVLVTISFQVTFVKSTMMKTFIESPTNTEMKKWMAAFFEHLKKRCTEKPGAIAKSDSTEAASPPATPANQVVVEVPSPPAGGDMVQTAQSVARVVALFLIVLLLWRISAHLGRIERHLARLADK